MHNVSTLDFLRRILPEQGLKCAAEQLPNGDFIHYFVDTHEELAAILLDIDARGNTAYHACAVYRKSGKRTQANALGAQCFWLDIDVGKDKAAAGKGYANKEAALAALEEFRAAYDLPRPMIICSGHGFHVYWLLTEFVQADDWNRVAKHFKAIVIKYGLLADKSRTADIASVLRPIGTHNRKKDESMEVCHA